MLLRQLQRPLLTRSSAAAGTWPPLLPLLRVALFHGDRNRSSKSPPIEQQGVQGQAENPPAKRSLFEELFPDEAKQRAHSQSQFGSNTTSPPSSSDQAHTRTATTPLTSEPSDHVAHTSTPNSSKAVTAPSGVVSYYHNDNRWLASTDPSHPDNTRTMLVVSAVSKYLEEADFYRLGASRARHLEGWVSGITRVVPARDPDTLEPLGHYYVLFETAAAASAWREEVRRLWNLAKEQRAPPLVPSSASLPQPPSSSFGRLTGAAGAPQPSLPERSRDLRADVESFTLVQPSQRWDIREVKYTAAEQALERAGSIVDQLARKAGTRFLVLVKVDGGRFATETLRAAIRADGAERNLAWRVKNLEGRAGVDPGAIMPFGRSGLKSQDHASIEESLRQQGISSSSSVNNISGPSAGEVAEGQRSSSENNHDSSVAGEYRRYARFIVPFFDEAEARRFVRHWHRRQLTLAVGGEVAEAAAWEETRMLNVTLLW
ncbi:hypothetical protein BX600DRAFT_446590 [Xylariales sp. PMI_506]|nr:hypothetical protein BX600DRAFT_446590 [Xylariales sp. PMI_506]